MSELMEIKKKFSLEELSELTGISRRTIRFYIQKGLMNGPEGEKRGAYYTTEHLEDLLRIKRMTEKHIPLNEIRKADTEDAGRTHQKLSNEPRYRSPFIGDLTRGTF